MADAVNNCFLVNAPAGSGKTTHIKAMVSKLTLENPKDNILCIITSVAKDRKAPSGGKSRTREADDAAIFA